METREENRNAAGQLMLQFGGKFFPNPLVNTFHGLWLNLWDMTAMNEAHYGASEPSVAYVLPYGDWETRGKKAMELLAHAYRVYFNEAGEQILNTYLDAFYLRQRRNILIVDQNDPRLIEARTDFATAQEALDNLFGGVRVTGRIIEVPEGHESLAAIGFQ